MMHWPAAIIDLDNCISGDQWRLKFIEPYHEKPNDRYWAYHNRCDEDSSCNLDLVRYLTSKYRLLVFTSRPETVRFKTENWLLKHSIHHDLMYMRPNTDHSTSVDLKRQMLSWLPAAYDVQVAIDDRQDVLDMYRQQGIQLTQRIFIHEQKEPQP